MFKFLLMSTSSCHLKLTGHDCLLGHDLVGTVVNEGNFADHCTVMHVLACM